MHLKAFLGDRTSIVNQTPGLSVMCNSRKRMLVSVVAEGSEAHELVTLQSAFAGGLPIMTEDKV
jgi:hypothetical protein